MNDYVMIDSSCWVEFLRGGNKDIADKVEGLIESDRAAICGIVELEIIQGIRNKNQSVLIRNLFGIIKYYDFERKDFINSGDSIKKLRSEGITIAPSHALIAELCIRNKLSLMTLDKDFKKVKGLLILTNNLINKI
jgi:predicted nucleic acid-binding protein